MTADMPSIVIVVGPTASGKSTLALTLADRLAGTVINADSQQVYRDLSILTARPDAVALAQAPHRLYGIIDAAENCSAGRWRRLALDEIAAARADGRLPILVGGTGLYIEALLHGLAALPEIPAAARAEALALHAQLGGAAFREALATLDPETAARLPPSDKQRLTRAYEVARTTGRPLSAWQRLQSAAPSLRALVLVLLPPRDALYRASDSRVVEMMTRGAVDEVKALLERGLAPDLPVMKAVGVRELGALLDGRSSYAEAVAAMQQATRQYGKRQYTWFRRRPTESKSVKRLTLGEQFSESLLPEIFSFIRQFLLTESG